MSKDDYVSVTLGTFTFFVWALIGFMQWFGSWSGFQCLVGTSWERLKAIGPRSWAVTLLKCWTRADGQIDSCWFPHDMRGPHSSHSNMKTSRDWLGIEIGDQIGHPRNLLPSYLDRCWLPFSPPWWCAGTDTGSTDDAWERHGLFRCGAFIAARSHRPSINIRKRPPNIWYQV